MRSTRIAWIPIVLLAGSSCTKEESAPPPPPPAQPTPPAPAAPPPPPAETKMEPSAAPSSGGGTASISGEVKLEGSPPQMQPLKRGVDPVCAKKPMNDEQVLSRDGKLENVVVWISEGVPAGTPPATPARLEQTDCMYRPRVQAVQDGQILEIHNGDKTLHNVRAVRGTKSLFNKAQVPGGPKITETARAGDVMQFKCDVHPWMKAYAVVVPHAFSDVTNDSGRFTIKDVPPGKYTLTAWHELFGTKKSEVTIQEGKATPILFVYSVQDRE